MNPSTSGNLPFKLIAASAGALLLSYSAFGKIGRVVSTNPPLRPSPQAILVSCSRGETSFDGKPGEVSTFTKAFVEGLAGAGTNGFGEVTLEALGTHVHHQVSAQTAQRQNPVLSGSRELLSAPVSATGRKRLGEGGVAGRVVVLAVGVSSYRNSIGRLNTPARDAKAFANGWSDLEHQLKREVSTKILADGRANRAGIVEEISRVTNEAKPDQLTVFFFSGMGVEQDGEAYLLPADATQTSPELTGLRLEELRRALAKLPGPSWLILDASIPVGDRAR